MTGRRRLFAVSAYRYGHRCRKNGPVSSIGASPAREPGSHTAPQPLAASAYHRSMTPLELTSASAPDPESPKRPPTDSDRLRMFVSLAGEHAEFATLLSTSLTVSMTEPEVIKERGDHRRRQLRAASARKFVLMKTDQVYLPKVFDSAASCVVGEATRMSDHIEGLRSRLKGLQEQSIFEYAIGYHDPVTDIDVVDDVVNGRILHADYTKWWRTEQRQTSGIEGVSLLFWMTAAEEIVSATRGMIVTGIEKGAIRLS